MPAVGFDASRRARKRCLNVFMCACSRLVLVHVFCFVRIYLRLYFLVTFVYFQNTPGRLRIHRRDLLIPEANNCLPYLCRCWLIVILHCEKSSATSLSLQCITRFSTLTRKQSLAPPRLVLRCCCFGKCFEARERTVIECFYVSFPLTGHTDTGRHARPP